MSARSTDYILRAKKGSLIMSSPIQPIADYVVVQKDDAITKTASGLLLTTAAAEKPKTATVIAVGKEVKRVKVGDRIIYKDNYSDGPTEVKIGKDEYILVQDKNIIATVK
jgi:chaperonin GroES